jgi:hypothetical protein
MPGPPSKSAKHGRTPTTGANDWIEVPDVPFDGAPPLPALGRRKWHAWTLDWYAAASTMPHCVRWKPSDWQRMFDLARMKDNYYRDGEDAKTSAAAEIRHRENALGMDEASRRVLKIKYIPFREDDGPDLRHEGHTSHEQETAASDPTTAGKVTSLTDRRNAIIKSA